MLTKLKCFFGWHEWEYTDQDGPHHGRVLRKRKCLRCGDSQKEIHAENGFYYWRFNPEWPRPPRERPTPKPRETMRDIHGVNAGDLPQSRLPQVNVDTPMPECKDPRKSWRDSANECDKIVQQVIDLLESTQETKKMSNDLKIKVQPVSELSEEDKAARVAPVINISMPRSKNSITLEELMKKTIIDGYGDELFIQQIHNDKIKKTMTLCVATLFELAE